MVRKFATLSVIIASIALTACNTIKGAGQDVSSAGNAVSSAAESAK